MDLDLVGPGGADPTGDPAADSGRLAAAGTCRKSASMVEPFDPAALVLPVANIRPGDGRLCAQIQETIKRRRAAQGRPAEIFRKIWDLARRRETVRWISPWLSRATIPYLTEPWYC